MTRGRRLVFLIPVLIGGGVLALALNARKGPEQAPPMEIVRSVRVIEAKAQSIVPRVIGYGTVRPATVWNAVAEVPGRVVYVHPKFENGALLEAGTEIVRIAPDDYQLKIAEAEANRRSVDAQLRELEVTAANTGKSLEIERRSLTVRQTELARKQNLLKRGTLAQAAIDEEQRNTLSQEQKVQELQNALDLIPSQHHLQIEQKALYSARLAQAKLDLERTVIRLPFTARIAEASVEATQYAQAGQVVGVADSIKTSEVEAQIPLSRFRLFLRAAGATAITHPSSAFTDLARSLNLTAVLRLRAEGEVIEWQGRFARISDTIDPKTRTVGVIAAVDDSYDRVVPGRQPPLVKGMFVEVELRAGANGRATPIPRSAIRDGGGKVFVADADGRMRSRPIEVQWVQGDFAAVTGLPDGVSVIVSDVVPAVDGMRVTTTLDAALSQRLSDAAAGRGEVR